MNDGLPGSCMSRSMDYCSTVAVHRDRNHAVHQLGLVEAFGGTVGSDLVGL